MTTRSRPVSLLKENVEQLYALVPQVPVFQLLASGPPCMTITALNTFEDGTPAPNAGRTFASLHDECSTSNKAAVMPLEFGHEILLAAVIEFDRPGGGSRPQKIFHGYLVSAGSPLVVGDAIGNSRLHLVLDLDETLISAQSLSGLKDRMDFLSRRMQTPSLDSSEPSHGLELLGREREFLQLDINMLREFSECNQVTINGCVFSASPEPAMAEDGQEMVRPIIRLHDLGIVLSRIDPNRPDTSMIMRIRHGWESLRSYLCGDGQEQQQSEQRASVKLRFDVFIATAAERGYALEAWRLLDPDCRLIPANRVHRRVVCFPGSRQKKLEKVFNLSENPGSVPYAPSPMPTAIILDDRPEVWDPSQRAQVLHTMPYFPLREMAAAMKNRPTTYLGQGPLPTAVWATSTELQRCQSIISSVRSAVFFHLDQTISRAPGLEPAMSPASLPTITGLLAKPTSMMAPSNSAGMDGAAAAAVPAAASARMMNGRPLPLPSLTPIDPRAAPQGIPAHCVVSQPALQQPCKPWLDMAVRQRPQATGPMQESPGLMHNYPADPRGQMMSAKRHGPDTPTPDCWAPPTKAPRPEPMPLVPNIRDPRLQGPAAANNRVVGVPSCPMGMAGPNPMGGPSGGPAMGLGPTPIGLPSQPAPSDPRISLQSVPARGLQPQQQMAVQDPRCNVMRLQKVHPLSASNQGPGSTPLGDPRTLLQPDPAGVNHTGNHVSRGPDSVATQQVPQTSTPTMRQPMMGIQAGNGIMPRAIFPCAQPPEACNDGPWPPQGPGSEFQQQPARPHAQDQQWPGRAGTPAQQQPPSSPTPALGGGKLSPSQANVPRRMQKANSKKKQMTGDTMHEKMIYHNCISLLNHAGQKQRKNISYSERMVRIVQDDGKPTQGWHVEVRFGPDLAGMGDSKAKKDAKIKAAFDALAKLDLPRPLTWSDCLPMPKDTGTQ